MEELKREFDRARRVSTVGAFVMYAIAVATAVIFLIYLYVIVTAGSTSGQESAWPVAAMLSLGAFALSNLLLGRFLWCFGNGGSPFGARQTYRLCFATALLAFKLAGTVMVPSFNSLEVVPGLLSLTSQPRVDLQGVTLIVLLLSLAMVLRYGNALKEDSDSIV